MRVAKFYLTDEESGLTSHTHDPGELGKLLDAGWALTGIMVQQTPPCFSPAPGKCVLVMEEG